MVKISANIQKSEFGASGDVRRASADQGLASGDVRRAYTPYEYQQRCTDAIISNRRIGLFLDMGLGKTIISLTAVKKLKYEMLAVKKVLVIAPKKVAEGTWVDEADKWQHTHMLRVAPVLGDQKHRLKALEQTADVYVLGRDSVVWLVDHYRNDWPFDMVIIDESSSFKQHTSKRFKALAAVMPKINRLVELTGTPSPNGLLDLWSQVYLLDDGERLYKKYTQFRERYFMPDKRSWSNGMVYSWKAKPGAEEAIMEKIKDICISMQSKDYISLPDIIYDEVSVRLDDDARKTYKTMEKDMLLSVSEDEEITAASAAALSNKLLQLANGAVYDEEHAVHHVHDCKIEAFLELMDSLSGKPILVFYAFQHDRDRIIEAVKKHDKTKVVEQLDGHDSVVRWNRKEIDVLLAHPASCAYGLNMQTGGNHAVWFGLTWNYELYAQANKRLHRQGQTEKVIIHHMVCKGTRDEDVLRALDMKEDAQDWVMESLKARIAEVRADQVINDDTF